MWADLVELMRVGLRRGRIVTRAARTRPRRPGRTRQTAAHYAYRRAGEPCRVCGTPVATEVLDGRNLFWCPTCQT